MKELEIIKEVERIADYLGCNRAKLLHEILGLIEKIISTTKEEKE